MEYNICDTKFYLYFLLHFDILDTILFYVGTSKIFQNNLGYPVDSQVGSFDGFSSSLLNPLMPVGSYIYQFFICCPRDAVSRTANVERTVRH